MPLSFAWWMLRRSGEGSVTGAGLLPLVGQKSAVVPSSGGDSISTRSGQSASVMSQKRHSARLGIRIAGLVAATLRISAVNLSTNGCHLIAPARRRRGLGKRQVR